MTHQPGRGSAGFSRETRATTMICDDALERLKRSLDAFLMSIRSQEQTVGAVRRLNERGLHSAQEAQALEATIDRLIVGRLLRGAVKDNADDEPDVRD